MNSITRRKFLKQSGAAGTALALAPLAATFAQSSTTLLTRCAVIGTNNRGLGHIGSLSALPNVEVSAVCDVEEEAMNKALKTAKKAGQSPSSVRDFRTILEDDTIDVVTIATPDHWHATMAILALQAGKAVYLEKPCSHSPHEGELLLDAIRKTGGIVQMGNQRRSFPNTRATIQEIHSGIIGRPYAARAWYANTRSPIGTGKEVAVPENLDYELWQGPAPREPYRDNVVHYNWHWFRNWGTGEALNNGTHEVDICRWALDAGFPTRVTSTGGRYAFEDDWEFPDTHTISWEFADDKSMTWEGRSCNGQPINGLDRGALIFGTEGTALLEGDNCTIYGLDKKVIKQRKTGDAVEDGTNTLSSTGANLDLFHFANFIDAVRKGTPLTSPISEGHISCALLQLGNIAHFVGRDLRLDPANGHIQNDEEASKFWARSYEPGWEPKV